MNTIQNLLFWTIRFLIYLSLITTGMRGIVDILTWFGLGMHPIALFLIPLVAYISFRITQEHFAESIHRIIEHNHVTANRHH